VYRPLLLLPRGVGLRSPAAGYGTAAEVGDQETHVVGAEHHRQLVDHHIDRLDRGRGLGLVQERTKVDPLTPAGPHVPNHTEGRERLAGLRRIAHAVASPLDRARHPSSVQQLPPAARKRAWRRPGTPAVHLGRVLRTPRPSRTRPVGRVVVVVSAGVGPAPPLRGPGPVSMPSIALVNSMASFSTMPRGLKARSAITPCTRRRYMPKLPAS